MGDVVDARRAFVQELQGRAIVEEVDYTRDGYETVVLTLGTPSNSAELEECSTCGAVGLGERIEDHDCGRFMAGRDEQ
ncbi:hypothetical protein [Halorussus sp. AFM4]|uniref:hypothetical protein n=1 Tax=Halorussus sp. AFM4 TaxID=3421651 RepID=UPI003EC10E15